MVITAKTALFIWLLAITVSAALSAAVIVRSLHPAPPPPPEPCHDSITRVYEEHSATCPPEARLETTEVPPTGVFYPYTLAKCVCPHPATSDAGTP